MLSKNTHWPAVLQFKVGKPLLHILPPLQRQTGVEAIASGSSSVLCVRGVGGGEGGKTGRGEAGGAREEGKEGKKDEKRKGKKRRKNSPV